MSGEAKFRAWLADLDERVIQEEFGYESGEFTVYPEEWRPLYDEGLTPDAAWKRALDAFAQERDEADRAIAAWNHRPTIEGE